MFKKIATLAVAASILASCTTANPYTGEQQMSKTTGGALLGATVGALGGLAVGHDANSRRNAALIGAGIGALGGGMIGNYMDQQEAQLRAELQGTGVSVTRNGDRIILNMPSNITFDTDQDAIKPEFFATLNSVGIVLKKFNRTLIDVNGHTDSVGNAAYNQGLSERRAMSVATYLGGQGLDQRRVSALGYGMSQPVASNSDAQGRAQNRRVEIQIAPITQG